MPPNPPICLLSSLLILLGRLHTSKEPVGGQPPGAPCCRPSPEAATPTHPQPDPHHPIPLLVCGTLRRNFCPTCPKLRFNQVVQTRGAWATHQLSQKFPGVGAPGLPSGRTAPKPPGPQLLLSITRGLHSHVLPPPRARRSSSVGLPFHVLGFKPISACSVLLVRRQH